jgi:hypothetical protein
LKAYPKRLGYRYDEHRPTVGRLGRLRVVIDPNDHRPAHVHVVGGGGEAVFILNCPEGPTELRESYGFGLPELSRIQHALASSWPFCVRDGALSMAVTEQEQAQARTEALRQAGHALSARYDRRRSRVVVELSTGVEVTFPTALAEGLRDAAPGDLAEIEVSPTGLGLHWPRLDADLYVPAILQGVLGSGRWMAGLLGARGGRARSPAKTAAARANGRKGGRPRGSANEGRSGGAPKAAGT